LTGKIEARLRIELKTSLNAYSFNVPLMKAIIENSDELLEYCAANQF